MKRLKDVRETSISGILLSPEHILSKIYLLDKRCLIENLNPDTEVLETS